MGERNVCARSLLCLPGVPSRPLQCSFARALVLGTQPCSGRACSPLRLPGVPSRPLQCSFARASVLGTQPCSGRKVVHSPEKLPRSSSLSQESNGGERVGQRIYMLASRFSRSPRVFGGIGSPFCSVPFLYLTPRRPNSTLYAALVSVPLWSARLRCFYRKYSRGNLFLFVGATSFVLTL